MRAIIIANGEGEALKPLTCTRQMVSLPLFGKPMLFHLLESLSNSVFKEVILITGYRALDVLSLFPDGEYASLKIENITTEVIDGSLLLPESEGEETLVISAECPVLPDIDDFLSFHKNNGNDVSYTENPHGIFLLGHSAEIIGDVKFTDLSSELLKIFLESNLRLGAYKTNSFFENITDDSSYKRLHFDILDNKHSLSLPKIADGFYCEGSVPSGEYIAVPPLWLGENVQIEAGAVIGPYAVISSGSLISRGAKIRESVLLENTYVSSKASVCGAVLGEGVSVKHGAEVFENAVIGADCIIGEGAVIEPSVRIWPKKTVPYGEKVEENIKYTSKKSYSLKISSVIAGDFGVELTPEKTAKLGAALGTLFENIKIGVGIDGEANSVALKCGLLGGLISTGAKSFDFGKCFNSQMYYYSAFCDLDFSLFISGGKNGAAIYMSEKGGIPFGKTYLRQLEQIMTQNEFNRCSGGDCRNVSVLGGMGEMYIAEVVRQYTPSDKADFEVSVFSSNELILKTVGECVQKIGITRESDTLIFKINKDGTQLSAIENNKSFSNEKILAAVSYQEMLSGNDIALPWDAPEVITSLGDSVGRHVYRFTDTVDKKSAVFSLGAKQLWSRDAVFLLFKLLSFMHSKNKTLSELTKDLPEFYIAKKIIEIDTSPTALYEKLLEADFKKNDFEDVIFKKNVKVKPDSDGKALKIIAEAVSLETANELCDDTLRLLALSGIDKAE